MTTRRHVSGKSARQTATCSGRREIGLESVGDAGRCRLTPLRRRQARSVGVVAHVAALEEHRRQPREVEAGEVGAPVQAVLCDVVRYWLRSRGLEGRTHREREPVPRVQECGVAAVGRERWGNDVEALPGSRPAVGVYGYRRVGVGSIGGLKLYADSAPLEFIREGAVMLAVLTNGGFAPGVRETLMLVARELDRLPLN